MKIIVTMVLCVFALSSSAQMENWYGVDLGMLGYKKNTVKFSQSAFQDTNTVSFQGGSFDLTADFFTEHVYFHLDAAIIPDMLMTMILRKKTDWWFNQPYGDYQQGQFLPVRVAFGDNITPYFGLYGGGQWQYSIFQFSPKAGTTLDEIYVGGNQYGLGIHSTFTYGPVLLRYSYMHDWIGRASHFKGSAKTHEAALFFGWPILGIYAKMNYGQRTMFAGEYDVDANAILKGSLDGTTTYYEQRNFNQFTFSFGIYATGLFSGVTKGTANGVGYVETETRRERNEKKKRTIEWRE